MFKHFKYFIIAALLTGVFILLFWGCEVAGVQDDEPVEQHFSYEIFDDNGELIKKVTHEFIDETEVEVGLGLFGDRFMPPSMVEISGIDPEDLKRYVIYLHAETGSKDSQLEILNFKFHPMLEQLKNETYSIIGLSIEDWLKRLRSAWEIIQDCRDEACTKQNLLNEVSPEAALQMINMNYHESTGSGIERRTKFIYQATGGYIELENVSGEYAEGSFNIDMAGVSAEILTADEFPEDPEYRTYHITGNFVTVYGDYTDLEQQVSSIILF